MNKISPSGSTTESVFTQLVSWALLEIDMRHSGSNCAYVIGQDAATAALMEETVTHGAKIQFAMMIHAFVEGEPAHVTEEPDPVDRDEGRTERMSIWVLPDLAKALRQRAKPKRWTLSGTIENACSVAKECEQGNCRPKNGKGS